MFFAYNDEAVSYLSKKDVNLGCYMSKYGKIEREVETDVFEALVKSIIGQQISNKAFATIYARFLDLCGHIVRAEIIMPIPPAYLRACGINMRKVQNIIRLAEYFQQNKIDRLYFEQKGDEEIIQELTQLSGIGVWTVEMFLLFCLQRQNILSYGDFGIKKGLCIVHGFEKIDKKTFMEFQKCYSPYGSVASLYLWEIANTFGKKDEVCHK